MGKNDFLTPKAIANRIKAKGLQKLRWYCQMCQKQCRDENGFKCHCMSESHQRQMQVFGQNPTRIVDGYSEEFEDAFLEHVRRSHRFSRVAATVVYNEYIADRHHVHMNSTRWATLTEFVKYLGRAGKCKVEETPKGWFMTYIDRGSETIFKDRLKNKRVKADLVEEERQERMIARQIDRAMAATEQGSERAKSPALSCDQAPPILPQENLECSTSTAANGKIAFSISGSSTKPVPAGGSLGSMSKDASKSQFQDDDVSTKESNINKRLKTSGGGSNGLSTLDKLMMEEEKAKERANRKDYWLFEGIVVKVMSKALAEKGYHQQKGVVVKVLDKYVGEIEMLENRHILRVDQEELETVIPQIGGLVKIVNGAYRGSNARLLSVNTEKFFAEVRLEKGMYDGRVLRAVDYEDICKLLQ